MSVYAIQAIDGGPIKIGYSSSPEQRLAQLQTAHHAELVVLYSFEADSRHETQLQEALADLKVRGEWYADDPRVLVYLRTAEVGIRLEDVLRTVCREAIQEIGSTFDRDAVAARLHEFADSISDGLAEVHGDVLAWAQVPENREALQAFKSREDVRL